MYWRLQRLLWVARLLQVVASGRVAVLNGAHEDLAIITTILAAREMLYCDTDPRRSPVGAVVRGDRAWRCSATSPKSPLTPNNQQCRIRGRRKPLRR